MIFGPGRLYAIRTDSSKKKEIIGQIVEIKIQEPKTPPRTKFWQIFNMLPRI